MLLALKAKIVHIQIIYTGHLPEQTISRGHRSKMFQKTGYHNSIHWLVIIFPIKKAMFGG